MGFVYVIAGIAFVVIRIYAATVFSNIAEEKGHNEKVYFWLPLLFGMVGYLAVIALPDRGKTQEELSTISHFSTDNTLQQYIQDKKPVAKEETKMGFSRSVNRPEERKLEEKGEMKQANVLIVNGMVTCPNCGTYQKGNRTVCYECGCKFIKE